MSAFRTSVTVLSLMVAASTAQAQGWQYDNIPNTTPTKQYPLWILDPVPPNTAVLWQRAHGKASFNWSAMDPQNYS